MNRLALILLALLGISRAATTVTYPDGLTQIFNPNGTRAGINVGSFAGDPSGVNNGDLWYNSTSNALKARINGATVSLGAGGGGSFDESANYTPTGIWDFTGATVTFSTFGVTTLNVTNISFEGSTADANETTIAVVDPTGDRTITLPNANTYVPVIPQILTFTGPTAARTITIPDADFTAARTDSANTFSGTQAFSAATFSSALRIPTTAGTSSLTTSGDLNLNTTDNQIGVYNGSKEVAIPLIYQKEFPFDPAAVNANTNKRLFLFTVGGWAPKGITIRAWRLSFAADPTTELDMDLKRADAFIGVANSAVMDVLDTTAGVSSESTAANINSGAVIANGKVVYAELGTAYSATGETCILEIEYEIEED